MVLIFSWAFKLVCWLDVDYLGSEACTLSVIYGPVPELNQRLEGQKSNYPAKGTSIFALHLSES